MAATGTPTPKLGLPQWNGTDAFLRSDFNSLVQTLDQRPGVDTVADENAKTTLSSGWNSAKNGRVCFVDSTKRIYVWKNTTWVEYGGLPLYKYASDSTDYSLTGSTDYQKDLIVGWTTIRPATYVCHLQVLIKNIRPTDLMRLGAFPRVNGARSGMGAYVYMDVGATGSTVTTLNSMAVMNIAAGTHNFGTYIQKVSGTVSSGTGGNASPMLIGQAITVHQVSNGVSF